MPTPLALARLERATGVTRVARVTGLDRAGVEVACAVRPGGHVLQVSNGKGLTWAEARAGAVLEATELWAAETPDPASLLFASAAELGHHAWPLEDQLAAPRLYSREARLAWVRASVLAGPGAGGEVLVPAAAVFCPPADGPWLGPAAHRWTSNGMGAHPDGDAALLHALLEALERDGLARALPEGWTPAQLRSRRLLPASLADTAPEVAALVERLSSQGLEAALFDLTPRALTPRASTPRASTRRALNPRGRSAHGPSARGRARLPVALAGALLLDTERGPIPVTAGYACALDAAAALRSALLEAAQSRLTDVHGAREDVAPADQGALRGLAEACAAAQGKLPAGSLEPRDRVSDVHQLLRALPACGVERLAAVRLTPEGFPAAVLKVLAPGLSLSGLL